MHLSFKGSKGEHKIKEDHVCGVPHLQFLKLKKMNIRTDQKPKLASIGDYWDDQNTREIFDLLKEYEYLFP